MGALAADWLAPKRLLGGLDATRQFVTTFVQSLPGPRVNRTLSDWSTVRMLDTSRIKTAEGYRLISLSAAAISAGLWPPVFIARRMPVLSMKKWAGIP